MDLTKENRLLKNKIKKLKELSERHQKQYQDTISLYVRDLKIQNEALKSKYKECIFWSNEKVKFEKENNTLKAFILNKTLEEKIK